MRKLLTCLLFLPTLTFAQTWGRINYDGEPWVKCVSAPNKVTRGLQNRHIALWASHGCYFDLKSNTWKWQRPNMFCTREDLFTQTIVVPYLIPMLEQAGAIVFTPRERDWQRNEVIVDNDDHHRLINYIEAGFRHPWQNTTNPGFAFHNGTYTDGENPFTAGTCRMAQTTKSKKNYSLISYQPNIPEEGDYAVYVSYQTLENSVDDARYTVWHQGQETVFHVNQQMGGSTWVYLGTFHFDKGCNQFNRVVLTNQSGHRGVVTADAVRFGGGMGNIERCGMVSHMPRAFEGARYWAQWAGMPYDVYSSRYGQDDYSDDINVRSFMVNHLAGGSCYRPNKEGRNVPLELSLAVHSDAGYDPSGTQVYGTLSICTTDNKGRQTYDNGRPRTMSRQLADDLLANTTRDLQNSIGLWTARETYDRNYSETRNPEMPSAIIETLSHQNFTDMRYGLDPNFRFLLARSIYKTLLRYNSRAHDKECVVSPLTPTDFQVELTDLGRGEVKLSWAPVKDPLEPTATPTEYIVYTACGHADFDNGRVVHGTSYSMRLEPGFLYHFRVAAVNRGGRSFPTPVLSAKFSPTAVHTAVIIDGFQRLAGPQVRMTGNEQGFDIDSDPGVSFGPMGGWAGRQLVFDRSKAGIEGPEGLGFGTDELAGNFFAGNDFTHVKSHAETIDATGIDCNICSVSREAIEHGKETLAGYDIADLVLGLQRNDGYSLVAYPAYTPQLLKRINRFLARGGALLTSGAYVASDITAREPANNVANLLHLRYVGMQPQPRMIQGLGLRFDIWALPNEHHYWANHTDIIAPAQDAQTVMTYADGYSSAVAYNGIYRTFTMGFPLECIQSASVRTAIMQSILNFFIQQ